MSANGNNILANDKSIFDGAQNNYLARVGTKVLLNHKLHELSRIITNSFVVKNSCIELFYILMRSKVAFF
jgi:hypothetical protein